MGAFWLRDIPAHRPALNSSHEMSTGIAPSNHAVPVSSAESQNALGGHPAVSSTESIENPPPSPTLTGHRELRGKLAKVVAELLSPCEDTPTMVGERFVAAAQDLQLELNAKSEASLVSEPQHGGLLDEQDWQNKLYIAEVFERDEELAEMQRAEELDKSERIMQIDLLTAEFAEPDHALPKTRAQCGISSWSSSTLGWLAQHRDRQAELFAEEMAERDLEIAELRRAEADAQRQVHAEAEVAREAAIAAEVEQSVLRLELQEAKEVQASANSNDTFHSLEELWMRNTNVTFAPDQGWWPPLDAMERPPRWVSGLPSIAEENDESLEAQESWWLQVDASQRNVRYHPGMPSIAEEDVEVLADTEMAERLFGEELSPPGDVEFYVPNSPDGDTLVYLGMPPKGASGGEWEDGESNEFSSSSSSIEGDGSIGISDMSPTRNKSKKNDSRGDLHCAAGVIANLDLGALMGEAWGDHEHSLLSTSCASQDDESEDIGICPDTNSFTQETIWRPP